MCPILPGLLLVSALGAVLGNSVQYSTDVSGLIEDQTPFRVYCVMNTSQSPTFNIAIFGYTAIGTQIFKVTFLGFPTFQMGIGAVTKPSESFSGYQTPMWSGTPVVPFVLGFKDENIIVRTCGYGVTAQTAFRAADLANVTVLANGPNLVECVPFQCLITN